LSYYLPYQIKINFIYFTEKTSNRTASQSNNLIGIKEVAREEKKFPIRFLLLKIKEENS